MRRIELTWDTGNWAEGIAEEIMEELAYALAHPQMSGPKWATPDSIRVVADAGVLVGDER